MAYTAPSIPISPSLASRRVELVFTGIDQAGPSFEGRVFLNNPNANESTAQTPEMGYAGAFHVYGYGTPAPPAIAEKARQTQGAGPVAPITKRLRPDETTARAALRASDQLIVTVVPVPADPGGPTPDRPFEHVEIVFERGAAN